MSDSRTRIWFASFVLVVFCLGLGAGVLIGTHMRPGPPFRREGPFAGPPGPDGGRGRGGPPPELLLERLDAELQLSVDQEARIKTVLEARRERLDTLQRDVRDRFEHEQRELRDEIRAVLTPEQQPKFDKWIEQEGARGRRGRGRF
jgi:hypothetical protein